MIRPKLVVVNTERDEQPRSLRDGRGYRIELTRNKLILYSMTFFLSLCFMFTLGVFVGRGMSMVRPDDFSIKGQLLRFLGLEKQTGGSHPGAAVSWEDPRKMLESLNYYEDLTRKGGTPLSAVPKPIEPLPVIPAQPEPAKETARHSNTTKQPAEKAAVQSEKPETPGVEGQYTLLVGSLRESEAQFLIEKLRAKGYPLHIESLDLGSSKWNRILLGSFSSREAAIKFAEEFNRKENMEALVMSSSN